MVWIFRELMNLHCKTFSIAKHCQTGKYTIIIENKYPFYFQYKKSIKSLYLGMDFSVNRSVLKLPELAPEESPLFSFGCNKSHPVY